MTAPSKKKHFVLPFIFFFILLKYIPHLQIADCYDFVPASANKITLLGLTDIST